MNNINTPRAVDMWKTQKFPTYPQLLLLLLIMLTLIKTKKKKKKKRTFLIG